MRSTPSRLPFEAWMIVKDPRRLRRARKSAGLTQVELAAKVKVTQQYVSALETGFDRDCSDRVAERMCQFLDVDVEDYFEERRVVRTPRVTTPSRAGRSTPRAVGTRAA